MMNDGMMVPMVPSHLTCLTCMCPVPQVPLYERCCYKYGAQRVERDQHSAAGGAAVRSFTIGATIKQDGRDNRK